MLLDAIAQAYTGRGDNTALIIGNKQWSYHELMQAVQQQADIFIEAGLQPGDRLVSLLPTGWHAVLMLLACAKLNLTYVPLPLTTTGSALQTAMQSVTANAVVVWFGAVDQFDDYLHNDKNQQAAIFCASASEPLINCRRSKGNSSLCQPVTKPTTQPAAYILTMTSGSTGNPKPIALSQATKLLRARAAIAIYGVAQDDVTLIATPLYHSLAQRLLFVSLLSGGCAVVMSKYQLDNWVATIAENKVSFTIAVSSQLAQLNDQDDAVFAQLQSLKTLVSSSALLALEDKQRLLSRLKCRFHECYGASEVAIVSDIRFGTGAPLGTVGKALPGVTVRICDNQGNDLPNNQIGEIWVKSPYRFSGYFQQDDVTEQAFQGDYFKTGDLGYLDCQGYLFFSGRKKEVIITGGVNVYPADVEQVLISIDGVSEVAAFPVLDSRLGEVVGVAIVAESSTILNQNNLAMQVLDQLADFQMPRHWFFVDALPKTAMGKLQRYRLSEQLAGGGCCDYQLKKG